MTVMRKRKGYATEKQNTLRRYKDVRYWYLCEEFTSTFTAVIEACASVIIHCFPQASHRHQEGEKRRPGSRRQQKKPRHGRNKSEPIELSDSSP